MFADGKIPFLGISLYSSHEDSKLLRSTYFPGARFIVVGLLSRPDSYYEVSWALFDQRKKNRTFAEGDLYGMRHTQCVLMYGTNKVGRYDA